MKDNIQFTLILFLFGYILFLQQCGGSSQLDNNNLNVRLDTVINIDTIMPTPVIVNLPRQAIPQPVIVYIDSSKNQVIASNVDSNIHQLTNFYQDSLEDENLTLYYTSLIDGHLLKNDFDYKLKVPKFITKTIEIPKPYSVPSSGLFINSEIGVNLNGFSSVTIGLQFLSKKGWSIDYGYDLLQNQHNISLGIRILNFKK